MRAEMYGDKFRVKRFVAIVHKGLKAFLKKVLSRKRAMTNNLKNQPSLRSYLLGESIEDDELRLIEERLLTDDLFFQELQITEEDLIDDYVNKKLNDDERNFFERHFLITPERQQKLRFALALQKRIEKISDASNVVVFPFWRRVLHSQPLRIAATILILLSAGFGVWRVFFSQSETDKGMSELVAAYQKQRPTEARITGFGYAPLPNTRGANNSEVDYASRDRAEKTLLYAIKDEPGAKSHHALGRVYLAQKQFDRAIDQFEKSLKLDPNNAKVYSDIGATFLEKANADASNQTEKNFETLAKALENFDKALKLDGSLLEALFNKGLCLQKMNLPEQASEAWRKYLEKDSSSKWADEARRNLQTIQEQKVQTRSEHHVLQDFLEAYQRNDDERAWTILSQTKEMITKTMIPAQLTQRMLAEETQSRKEDANASLSALLYAGELEKKKTGDPYFLELAQYYKDESNAQRDVLKQAHGSMNAGYELCFKSDYKAATLQFEEARDLFAKTGDDLEARLADYWIGYGLSLTSNLKESNLLLHSLVQYSEKKNFKWLLAQALCWLANNYFVQSEYSKAIEYNTRSLAVSEDIADTYNQQKALSQLASIHGRFGDLRKAMLFIQRSLALARSSYFSSLRQTWRNYLFAAQVLYGLKLYETAVFYSHEAFQIALDHLKSQIITHNSQLYLAQMHGGTKNYQEAIRFAEESRTIARSLEANLPQKILLTDSTRQIAHLYREAGNCEEALKNYDWTIQAYSQTVFSDYTVNAYDARKGRLLCYLSQNDTAALQTELPLVLELFEKHRSQILEEEIRNAFFDNEQNVYDIAIDYAHSQQNSQQAFEYSESSKARSLLDLLTNKTVADSSDLSKGVRLSNTSRSLSLREIQSEMPQQTQIVQYALLPERMLIWVVSKDKFTVVEKKITFDELNSKVSSYIDLVVNAPEKQEEIRNQSLQLYDLLIGPIQQLLNPRKDVCIVPDKSLYRLPFASLISPQNGRYFIADYALLFSPSATVFVLCSDVAQQRESIVDENLLSVGNPSFDHQTHPELPDLPAAKKEVQQIAANYRRETKLIATEATKENFLAQMRGADVIHFAGHYVVDETSPLSSKLLLASVGPNKTASDLTALDIFRNKPDHPKLVVLSACRTGVERYYNGEGMIGAARTFLAVGAPVVVASQWPVDSDAAAELMIRFHNYRKRQGSSTTTALRKAQLDLLTNADERFRQPYYWAAFLPIGGYARY
jgi:CHAT domain-containing protein/Tfp pilus assembly protein PilF